MNLASIVDRVVSVCNLDCQKTGQSAKMMIDRNCDVLPIEYDLLIVMFVNINITITIFFFFEPIQCLVINNMLPSNLLPVFSFFAFLHGHVTAILTSHEWYANNT